MSSLSFFFFSRVAFFLGELTLQLENTYQLCCRRRASHWKWIIIHQRWMWSGSVSEAGRVKGLQTNSKVTIKDESFFLGFHFECVIAARRHEFQTQTATFRIRLCFTMTVSQFCHFSFCLCFYTCEIRVQHEKKGLLLLWPAVCFLNLLKRSSSSSSSLLSSRSPLGSLPPRHARSPAPRWRSLITKKLCDFWRQPRRQQVVLCPQYFIALQKECSISDFTLRADVENTKKLNSSSEVRRPNHPAYP